MLYERNKIVCLDCSVKHFLMPYSAKVKQAYLFILSEQVGLSVI